jgi:tripartite-type tricarboxylate transporter receptor subunit TctC
MFLDVASGLPFVLDKRVKVFGVASDKRFERLPDIPTLAEAGLDFQFDLWQGVVVPSGTPAAIVGRLNQELRKALTTPSVRKRLLDIGAEAVTSTPEEFAAYARDESERWGKLIVEKGIRLE